MCALKCSTIVGVTEGLRPPIALQSPSHHSSFAILLLFNRLHSFPISSPLVASTQACQTTLRSLLSDPLRGSPKPLLHALPTNRTLTSPSFLRTSPQLLKCSQNPHLSRLRTAPPTTTIAPMTISSRL